MVDHSPHDPKVSVYTLKKRVLIVFNLFQGLAKSLEQPEVKEWLALTKDTLMGDKPGKEQDEEAKKLNGILKRYARIGSNKLERSSLPSLCK